MLWLCNGLISISYTNQLFSQVCFFRDVDSLFVDIEDIM